MQAQNVLATLAALSAPRMASYRAFFGPVSDNELYGLYCWNEAVSLAFLPLINSVEISLRNAFHRELSRRFGSQSGTPSSDWYNAIALTGKSLEKVRGVTHIARGSGANRRHVPRQPAPSPDDVVARQTFGFWKHMMDVGSQNNGQPVPWASIIPDLVPHHPQRQPAYWSQRRQGTLFSRIDLVGDTRNRIAHLEPVWKMGPLMEEARAGQNYVPRQVQPAPATAAEAIARLLLIRNRAFELLYWLSDARADDYKNSDYNKNLLGLLTQSSLIKFRNP